MVLSSDIALALILDIQPMGVSFVKKLLCYSVDFMFKKMKKVRKVIL